jgi:hypothetical protein
MTTGDKAFAYLVAFVIVLGIATTWLQPAWGAAFGLLTPFAAVAAAYFAKKAADHTEESASVAREASRAWLVCEDITLIEPVRFYTDPQLGDQYEMRFDITLRNTGQGLARRVLYYPKVVTMHTAVFEPVLAGLEAEAKATFRTHYANLQYRGLPIASGQTAALRSGCGGPGPNLPTLQEVKGGSFFVLCYVGYLDHFGRPQSSIFAFHPDADSVHPWDYRTLVRSGAIGDAT